MEVFGAALVRANRAPVTGFAAFKDRETQPVDTHALVALLFKDQLLARLDSLVDAIADDGAALTDEAREAKEQELLASILRLEREEEFFLEQCHGEVIRRADADPRAVLGIA